MGAIGVAQLVRERAAEGLRATGHVPRTSFVGFDALAGFSYTTEAGLACPFCQNHCSRTRITSRAEPPG